MVFHFPMQSIFKMKTARRTYECSTGDYLYERVLARGERHLVVGVVAVPAGDQFFCRLADVLTVEDRTGENARDIQSIGESGIGTERNRQISFQVDARCKRSEPFHFDRATSAIELDDLVTEFFDGLID